MELQFNKVLVCSTGNLPKHTADALDGDFDSVPMRMSWEFGWLVWCDSCYDFGDKEHPELAAILDFALTEHGCQWVRFDRDADYLPDNFPAFEW